MGKHSNHLCGVCNGKVTTKVGRCFTCKRVPTKFNDKPTTPQTPTEKIGDIQLKKATQEQVQTHLTEAKDFRDIKFCPKCNPVPPRIRNKIDVPVFGRKKLDGMTREEIVKYIDEKYAIYMRNEKKYSYGDCHRKAIELNMRFHPEVD